MSSFLNKQVSIIIVNYNTTSLVFDCIKSIKDKTCDVDYEIIVVDNASKAEEIEALRKGVDFKLIECQTNNGFGTANNIGSKQAIGKYLFLLNSDTIILDNIVKTMYDYCERNKGVGAIGCLLVGEERQDIHSAGAFRTLCSFLKNLFRKDYYDHNLLTRIKDKEAVDVDYITGADLFLSKKIFDKVNGFDENIFMYNEDSDLQLQISHLGYKRQIINSRSIVHLCGASQPKRMTYKKYKMSLTSLKYYVYKNFKGSGLGMMFLAIVFSNIKNLIRFRSDFSGSEISDLLKYSLTRKI